MSVLAGFGPQIIQGAIMTIEVSLCALIAGMVLAIVGIIIQQSRFTALKLLVSTIAALIRGLPELLVIFGIYFGGSIFLSKILGHSAQVSAFFSGVLALSLIFSSYAIQTLRGALMAVHKGQAEAGEALGLSGWFIFKTILLPQAWRHALPGLGNLWLVLLKDSALVSLIGLGDLMNKAEVAASTTRNPFEFYLIAGAIFLLFTSISQVLLNRFNKTLAYPS